MFCEEDPAANNSITSQPCQNYIVNYGKSTPIQGKLFPLAVRSSTIEAALTNFVEQSLVADLEQPSRLGAVPPHPLKDFLDCGGLGGHSRLLGNLLQSEVPPRPCETRILGLDRRERGRGPLRPLGSEGDLLLDPLAEVGA